MRAKWLVFALIVGLVLGMLLLAYARGATTLTFTSTADFDAGTKNNPADGNFGVETSTDNTATATGAFELANLEGDTFAFADTDANTFKWNPWTRGDGDCSLGGGSQSITSGVFRDVIGDDGLGNGATGCGIRSDATISGDFDVRIRTEMTDSVANDQRNLCMYNEAVAGCDDAVIGPPSGTVDGVYVRNLVGTIAQAFTMTNGVGTQQGTNTDPLCGDGQFWWRIARTGTSWTTYFSCNGSTWTTDETFTFSVTGALTASIEFQRNGPAEGGGTTDFDSWQMTTGTADSGGFRTSGTWTSATQTFVDEVATQVELTFSAATSANYIDSVSIRDSAGNQLFIDDTDRTSGTSAVITVTYTGDLEQNWGVRVALASGGAGTAVVESVVVTTDLPPRPPGVGGGTSPSLRASCSYYIAAFICRDDTDYSGFRNMERIDWYLSVYPRGAVFTPRLYITDGMQFVGSTPHGGQITIRLPLREYLAPDRGATVVMVLNFANGGHPARSFNFEANNVPLWVVGGALGLASVAGALGAARTARDRNVYFAPIGNPARPVSVEEYPPGWRSYRYRDPEQYRRVRSKRIGGKWYVFGIRPATAAERTRTGRKYYAEVQAIRERIR